jgi:Homeodomain-like domain
MGQTICVIVSASDRRRLEEIAADRSRPRRQVERARVVLALTAHGTVQQVADAVGVSRPLVWRWQQRFSEAGVEGLLRDKTRKPGTPPIPTDVVARVVTLTCGPPSSLNGERILLMNKGSLGAELVRLRRTARNLSYTR